MKLLVCFKVIADLDQMTSEDYIVDEQMNIDTSFVKTMLNCFDESGLEFGLRLSEEAEGLNLHIKKSALTVGGEHCELYLKTLCALQYDHAVRVRCKNEDLRFQPGTVGAAIANYTTEYKPDIILMGRQAPEGSQSAIPQMVSEQLKIPLVSNVIDVHLEDEQHVRVLLENRGAVYEQVIKLPVILTIGNAVISKLRVPTLKDRMLHGKRELEYQELGDTKKELFGKTASLEFIDRKRGGIVLEEQGEAAVEQLIEDYVKERLEEI